MKSMIPCALLVAIPAHAEAPSVAKHLVGSEPTETWIGRDDGPIEWTVADGVLCVKPGTGSIRTERAWGDMNLHVEFRLPESPDGARGQARSNSGVYIQQRYEVQILDSHGDEPAKNGCGAIYGRTAPDVNASRPAGEWQHFDIDFTAPRFGADGTKTANARLTVRHNGTLIHDDVEVAGKTGAGKPEGPEAMPLLLQDHGAPVEFRNVWLIDQRVGWSDLVGDSLDGWIKRGGAAEYTLENGVIIGETRPNTPNTFLCTERDYGDFLLSLEFRVDDGLNSGIQIRSLSTPEHRNGRVHGYQVEIDPSERSWSAGIYDEARRGWLHDLSGNEPARKAFRHGSWNHYLIEARGDRMRTWINGVPAADLTDDMTASGFIGLQVHGVGGRTDPLRVRWRKIRILELN